MASTIRAAVHAVDTNVTVGDIGSLEQQVEQSLIEVRFIATLSTFFGLLALLLASIGLYGIMSYSVVRRTNEIGIRVALGATRSGILKIVLQESLLLAVIGIAFGLPLTLATTRLISSQLFGVSPTDPATIAALRYE